MSNKSALFHGDLVNSTRILCTPSDFVKSSLLHIQEIGTLQATKPHISKRKDLSSYLFFIVNSGDGLLTYENTQYPLHSGDCVFIDCKKPYAHQTSNNLWKLEWVHFNGPTISNIYQKYIERGGLPAFTPKSTVLYSSFFSKLYNIASSDSFTRDLEVNTELSSLLTLLMNDSRSEDDTQSGTKKNCMLDLKNYLDENFSKKITLDDLAERYFINKYYLTRVFKSQFGISIMEYLLSIRITEAKNMLRFTDKSAEQIGYDCGIGDIYYFSKVFKKIEGIGIREYRTQWKS